MPTTWTLEDLYRGIARGWKALAVVVVVCLAFSYLGFRVFPEKYAAAAVHTVEPISVLSTGSSFATVNMDTEKIVATSTGVLQAAAEALDDGTTVRELADATELEVPRGSQVLRFIVTTANPETSAAWANAIATAYGQQRADAARAVVEQTSTELQTSIDQLRERLNQLAANSPEATSTELQIEALVAEQARLLGTPFYAGSLITPAVAPHDSERPSVLVFAAGGLFLGLLLGSFAALLWSGRAGRRDQERTETARPRATSRHARAASLRAPSAPVPTSAKPSAPTAEQFRWPRTDGAPLRRVETPSSPPAAPGSPIQAAVRTGRGLPASRRLRSSRR